MKKRKPLTPGQISWFCQYYPILPTTQIMEELLIGEGQVKDLVKQYGLVKIRRTKPQSAAPKKKACVYMDEQAAGYCIDCKHYKQGGICSLAGKDTGALWQKKCCTREA
jgi:hypothetical protein